MYFSVGYIIPITKLHLEISCKLKFLRCLDWSKDSWWEIFLYIFLYECSYISMNGISHKEVIYKVDAYNKTKTYGSRITFAGYLKNWFSFFND